VRCPTKLTPPSLATPAAAAAGDPSLFLMQMTAHKHRQQPLARKGPKVINLGVSRHRALTGLSHRPTDRESERREINRPLSPLG